MIDQIVEPQFGLIFFMLFGRESVSNIVQHHYEVEHGNPPLPNQVIIYDLTQGEVEFSIEDLYKNNELNKAEFDKKGHLSRTALISKSSVINIMAQTVNMFNKDMPIKLESFTTLADAVWWLDLSAHLPEIEKMREEMIHRNISA